MPFEAVLDQIRELLHQRGRVTYRALKLRYPLDDETLAGVTEGFDTKDLQDAKALLDALS